MSRHTATKDFLKFSRRMLAPYEYSTPLHPLGLPWLVTQNLIRTKTKLRKVNMNEKEEKDQLEKDKDRTVQAQFKEVKKIISLLDGISKLSNEVVRGQIRQLLLDELKSKRNFINHILGEETVE